MSEPEILKRLVEGIASLVMLPGDPGQERPRLEFCEHWLASFDTQWQEVEGFGGNLLVEHPGQGPDILLCAHVDTVPPAVGWVKPREPDVIAGPEGEGPRLVGLGAADMLAGVVVAVEAFLAAAENERQVTLLLASDEEGYSQGINTALDLGLAADLALVPEPSHERVMMGARGRQVLDIELKGRSAHAARPELGMSAAAAAGSLVKVLEEMACPEGAPLETGAFVVLELEAKALGLSVPATATLKVDRHTVMGEGPEEILRAVKELAEQQLPEGMTVEVQLTDRPTPAPLPYLVDGNDLNVQAFHTYLPIDGRDPIYGRSVGDYNFLASGMPTLVFGPRGGNWHAPGEWVDLESVARVLDIYSRFLLDEGA